MGRLATIGAVAIASAGAAACGGDTGIVLEISMSAELTSALESSNTDFETLRVWVGQPTGAPGFFAAAGDAYYSADKDRAALVVPFRYLLEPGADDLDSIGPMVFAAAVGDDPDDPRLPFRLQGFAVADDPLDFADGEIRVVPLALAPPDGARGTIDDACIIWGMDTQQPSRIGPDDDLDCDGAVGAADCNDLDPRQNNLDYDSDGISSCDGDCMDDPDDRVPWLDPATVHPGATDPEDTSSSVCDHVDQNCNGFCGDATVDRDGSGSSVCGVVASTGGVCDVVPADCDENTAGQQAATDSIPEACNGRDDACDGFLPPALPCLRGVAGGPCFFGEVACDELEGEYRGEADGALHCKEVPSPFNDLEAPGGLCGAVPPSSCLESGDPLECAYPAVTFPRADCLVSIADGLCDPDRTPLSFPGQVVGPSCAWYVVGWTFQAEWEIGFVTAGAALDTAPLPMIDECTPHLAVRARVRNAAARTVMLLFATPETPALGARPLLVHLTNEGAGACTGVLTCQASTGG